MKEMILLFISCLMSISVTAQDECSVYIDDCWLEHNVYVNNTKGMKIHSRLEIENMRGKTLCVIAFFAYDYNEDERIPIKSRTGNNRYRNGNNELCTGDYAYAKYDETIWDDFVLFIPYNEFGAAVSESSSLCCVVSVQSKSGVPYAVSEVMTFDYYKD